MEEYKGGKYKMNNNIIQIEGAGGWKLHYKGVFTPNLKMKEKCNICNNNYVISKEKNLEIREIFIYLSSDSNIFAGDGITSPTDWKDYEKVKQYVGICPNCGNKVKMFCESTNEIIREQYYYNNSILWALGHLIIPYPPRLLGVKHITLRKPKKERIIIR